MIPRPSGITKREGVYKLTGLLENAAERVLKPELSELGREGYQCDISPDAITITAPSETGLFYGMQTLKQLVPVDYDGYSCELPCQSVTDKPSFAWRGLMLDTARHHFSVGFIKKQIDFMAMHKLNTLHWHLVEDQGWRIEIKKYPRLVEIGSKRKETPVPSDRNRGDGIPYAGHYTHDDAREIVAYAAERHITVVPEIELPGHSLAALAAYPELGCSGGPYEVRTRWGIEKDVYCAGNDRVFEFLEDVFDEILAVFPSPVIHIGGDECPKARWKECPKCQQRIKDNDLGDEHGLQSYFIKRIQALLNSRGRAVIGWDEILEGGLAPNAAVMSWRGSAGGVEAARAGHDVVMSPNTHCYLDYYQGVTDKEPPAIGGLLPLPTCYEFEPVPRRLTAEEAKHVIGGQGNLWSEYIQTPDQAEYMIWPRMSAIAEVLWTYPEERKYGDFVSRLKPMLKRMDKLNVNYRKLD